MLRDTRNPNKHAVRGNVWYFLHAVFAYDILRSPANSLLSVFNATSLVKICLIPVRLLILDWTESCLLIRCRQSWGHTGGMKMDCACPLPPRAQSCDTNHVSNVLLLLALNIWILTNVWMKLRNSLLMREVFQRGFSHHLHYICIPPPRVGFGSVTSHIIGSFTYWSFRPWMISGH